MKQNKKLTLIPRLPRNLLKGKTRKNKYYAVLLHRHRFTEPKPKKHRPKHRPLRLPADSNGPLRRQTSATLMGCMAHTRRNFIEAQRGTVKGKTGKADWAINHIQELYRAKSQFKDKTLDERHPIAPARRNRNYCSSNLKLGGTNLRTKAPPLNR